MKLIMPTKRIQSVAVRATDDVLQCQIVPDDINIADVSFAFYVFRNENRIHIAAYSSNNVFEFDTKGLSGYYRIVGFMKFPDGEIEHAKSVPIFFKPYELDIHNAATLNADNRAYSLKGEHWSFPALYYPGDSDALFVLMPSAVSRSSSVLPVFHRWTWAGQGIFPGHVLCIADPTLELQDELQLGWCLGNKTHPAVEDLAKLVIKIAEAKNIPNHRIIVYGSSAGGFAALALAAAIDGSIAVAINAQTDILSYDRRGQVELVRQACFDGLHDEAIRLEFEDRVNMSARWKDATTSKALLVQNELDSHHFEVHFKPFWSSLGGLSENGISTSGTHTAWVYQDDAGHAPETIEMAKKIMSMIF